MNCVLKVNANEVFPDQDENINTGDVYEAREEVQFLNCRVYVIYN